MSIFGKFLNALKAKLAEAQKAEKDAHGKYAEQFAARKAKAAEIKRKQQEIDQLTAELKRLDEEIAPIQAEVAPFGRRRYELERAIRAIPLLDAMEPFRSSIGDAATNSASMTVDQQRKVYKGIPPVVVELEKLAKQLVGDDGKCIMAADARKLTSRVWDAVTSELSFARHVIAREVPESKAD